MNFQLLTLLLASLIAHLCCAARNEREEAICQPFLTSHQTSPLIGTLKRNLTVDEDGEFACELVLQDESLPLQIRATIHEGLSWLAIRHVHMGLNEQKKVARHLRMLSLIAPYSYSFQSRAGFWGLDSAVGEPEEAVKNLHEALYGLASKDKEAVAATADSEIRYELRKDYAKALGMLGNYSFAMDEYLLLLAEHPLDFGAAFQLLDIVQTASDIPISKRSEISAALKAMAAMHLEVGRFAQSDYTGFQPTSQRWQPTRLTELPTAELFAEYVDRREPVVISLGSDVAVDEALHWKTRRWNDLNYLKEKAGEEGLQVECMLKHTIEAVQDGKDRVFGFGSNSLHKLVTFERFLNGAFDRKIVASNESELRSHPGFSKLPLSEQWDLQALVNHVVYLNTQRSKKAGKEKKKSKSHGAYRPPLDRFVDDISPTPPFVGQYWENMTEVGLWMGDTGLGSTTSRLHSDATDNVYVLLKGQKTFRILPPTAALHLHTMSPTFYVSPNGLSYQLRSLNKLKAISQEEFPNRQSTSSLPETFNGTFPADESRDQVMSQFVMVETPIHNSQYFHSHAIEVNLQQGDMLFLPTGWFHQVTSSGGKHVALNYWWKPPNWNEAVGMELSAVKKLLSQLWDNEDKRENNNNSFTSEL